MPLTASQVAAQLLVELREGAPEVGSVLESDARLARRLGISKDVARRAWLHLQQRGLVTRVQGVGTLWVGSEVPKDDDRLAALERRVAALERLLSHQQR